MKINKPIILLMISLLSGVLFGQAEIFSLMKLGFLLLIIIVISGIVLLVGTIKNNSKIIKSSGLVIVLAILSGITTLSISAIKKNIKEKKVDEIISELANYKEINTIYPVDLQTIGYDVSELNYTIDSAKTEFKLRYLVDGWHFREYSSKTNKWISGD